MRLPADSMRSASFAGFGTAGGELEGVRTVRPGQRSATCRCQAGAFRTGRLLGPVRTTMPHLGSGKDHHRMSTREHLYFHTRQSPPAFAAAIAPGLGMAVIRGGYGAIRLSRPLPDGGAAGGELRANELADPAEPSFLDVFPLVRSRSVTADGSWPRRGRCSPNWPGCRRRRSLWCAVTTSYSASPIAARA